MALHSREEAKEPFLHDAKRRLATKRSPTRRVKRNQEHPFRSGHIALRVAAVAGFHLDAVLVGILACFAAVLFSLDFGRQHAVTEIVRAFNRLMHGSLFTPLGIVQDFAPGDLGGLTRC